MQTWVFAEYAPKYRPMGKEICKKQNTWLFCIERDSPTASIEE